MSKLEAANQSGTESYSERGGGSEEGRGRMLKPSRLGSAREWGRLGSVALSRVAPKGLDAFSTDTETVPKNQKRSSFRLLR